jgi:hypothetical protein
MAKDQLARDGERNWNCNNATNDHARSGTSETSNEPGRFVATGSRGHGERYKACDCRAANDKVKIAQLLIEPDRFNLCAIHPKSSFPEPRAVLVAEQVLTCCAVEVAIKGRLSDSCDNDLVISREFGYTVPAIGGGSRRLRIVRECLSPG